jgi:hypothetical protein
MCLKSIAIINKDNSPKPLYNEIIKRGAGEHGKNAGYEVILCCIVGIQKGAAAGVRKRGSICTSKSGFN